MIVLSNVAVPTDGIRLIQGQVTAYIESESAGEGELTIAESSVTWISNISGQGFSLTYPSIILHAVSRDPSVFPEECIYVLADAKGSDIGIQSTEESVSSAHNGNGIEEQAEFDEKRGENGCGDDIDDDGDDDDDKAHLAIRFSPQDKTILQNIYQQMCECQELNPDEGDDFSDDFTMDPDGDFSENKSDEEGDYEGNDGEGDQNTLYFQNISTNMRRHETNGDHGDAFGSEQMDEG
uniref:Methylosome subunit pICln n=1 Tax=Wuchereria bancrofti TaxID=6293 RepID=A0AAF5PMU7_WUCBA